MAENHISIDPMVEQGFDRMADEGMTPLLVAGEGRFLGVIGVADEIKASSRQAIRSFGKMGIRVVMLTKVAMIGDGINDAPALAAADVGMAIGAGTDVAMESADIVLMKSDLRDAVTAVRLSRAVIRNIKENLFWAFFYNCIQIRLNPMFGAAAMSLSSIFVVGNALRLRHFRSGFQEKAEQNREVRQDLDGKPVENANTVTMQNIPEQTGEIERSNTMTKTMTIEGMMCAHCTGRVQKALEGVTAVTMSLEEKTATVELAKEVPDEVLTGAVTEAGYEVKGIA